MMEKRARRRRLLLTAAILGSAAASIGVGAAGAGTTVTETTVEKQFTLIQPSCVATERLVLTGTVRDRLRITVDDSGGMHIDDYYSEHGTGSGYAATDPLLLSPIAKYTVSDEQLQSTNILGPTFEYNAVFNTRVIRQAERVADDDLYLVWRLHMTFNANGVPTAIRLSDAPEVECR